MSDPSCVPGFDAVLCDLDGVVRHFDAHPMDALDRAWGLPAGTTARAAFRPPLLEAAVTGRLSDEEWRAAIAVDLADACGGLPAARELVAAWSEPLGRVDTEVLDLLTAARRTVPVVLVTNATTRLERDLAALGLAEAFDAVVNTARIGHCKPDPRVYGIAAERTGVPVERCLLVDDTLANVEAAQAFGMCGLHYTGPRRLRAVLGQRASGFGSGV
jgi:putative hydrolase of the HAD superfamily